MSTGTELNVQLVAWELKLNDNSYSMHDAPASDVCAFLNNGAFIEDTKAVMIKVKSSLHECQCYIILASSFLSNDGPLVLT